MDVMSELVKLYEEFIGVLYPGVFESIREFAGRYRGDVRWLREAFLAAGNNRRWPLVRSILERYEAEGGPPHADLTRDLPGKSRHTHWTVK